MNFEDFLQTVTPKVGPKAAFDAHRDIRLNSLKRLLIEKNIFSQEEIDRAENEETVKMAKKIQDMPPIPSQ